jgi:hypothetical protein
MRVRTAFAAVIVMLGTLMFGATPAHAHAAAEPYYTYISVYAPSSVPKKMVLDIQNYSTEARGVAQLWELRDGSDGATKENQRWTIRESPYGSGIYEIENQLSHMCLDKSQDTPNANGNRVYQYPCVGTPNQRWKVIHTVDGNNSSWWWAELQNQDGGRCLDVPGANFTNGKELVVWDCNGGRNQRWNIF